ncbi:TetR family transcriptional regulator [Paenibacillus mucilaginosus 3016]|uniref:TetR family transcriptional regulator n=2 Tax=Paenibacillus mucilaginosus TaxID=61624 RepID=H6NB65_9BACL|nr:TetR/AcrR family transcriptional regulator [Paenibacillus mucilaginosus]AFC32033.1 TetR family transcriptional regulator [Paenibacillus mucilaginosus 3016]AFH64403.1 TetR family transcriptional regulator [Paenibacillus mucilaginosus K02]WFA20544.1 TetR/AcrR family transcriptional regulator [Paenibacillus mucilaginosus]
MSTEPSTEDAWLQQLLELGESGKAMTNKQRRIVQAAVEIFAEKGYSAASTSEIAQKAGVAEGTIFRHYKTKKDLLLSIIGPTMAKLVAPFVLRDFTPVLEASYAGYDDFLRALVRNRLEFVRRHLPVIRILLQEIPFQTELREEFKAVLMREVYVRVEKAIHHFQAQGQLIALPAFTVVRLTVSVVVGFLMTRFMLFPELDWNEEEELEICVNFIMNGLSAGPSVPRGEE